MKELQNIFGRRYSAVSTKDASCYQEYNNQQRRSLSTKRLGGRFSILDSFFTKRKAGERTRLPKCAFLLMSAGLILVATGVLFKIFEPYDRIFKWKLVFEEGGEIFGLWEKPPVDLYLKVYLWNITNADEFLAGREKLRVEQVGPYVYKEIMEHDKVVFNDNNTISTVPKHPLVWQEQLSEGNREDDQVVMLNIALLSIAQVGSQKSYFLRLPINLLIRQTNSQPIVKMTAREFMFGFETPLTTLGNTFLPDWISFDKVGLIDRMYDFDTDFETFFSGKDDPSKSGLYETYRGSKHLQQWDNDHCNNIQMASDGTKFKSFQSENDTMLFFRKSMCRPLRLVKEGEPRIASGLEAYKYILEDNSLDNGNIDERNKCYCRNGYCQPSGLVDVTDCYYGFPISLSFPHFMDADPEIQNNILGLQPNRSLHSSFFVVQPKSGLPLNISVKFQINMHMRDVNSMAHVERFSHMTIPMLWFEITMPELPLSLKSRFNLYLNILTYIDSCGLWLGVSMGTLCLIIAIIRASSNLKTLLDDSFNPSTTVRRYSDQFRRSSVYKPCEQKLMEVKAACGNGHVKLNDTECEIDLESDETNAGRKYMLENEPVMVDIEDDDEGQGSDDSCRSSSMLTSHTHLQDDMNKENFPELQDRISFSSSESDNDSKERGSDMSWQAAETSNLIEDIGTSKFTQLNETNANKNENKRRGSNVSTK